MLSHKLRGSWDQMSGIGREFLGELTGNGATFSAGERLRQIGRLEMKEDLSHAEAKRRLDPPKQEQEPSSH